MRLSTYNKCQLVLRTFDTNPVPSYAILSQNQEVSFQDLEAGRAEHKAGDDKIRFCGRQAAQDEPHYFWVDTCCIDKSNNTELTETINSMFAWHHRSAKCYVYLPDVSTLQRTQTAKRIQLSWPNAFHSSRCFTRGWTLQELIARASVDFISLDGEHLGTKATLAQGICSITGIRE
jgi:hypothetical protein